MQCDVAREALSARIDGEREPVPAARVDEHLETCRDCCSWYILADEQARKLRIRGAGAGRDLSQEILAAAGVEPVARHRRWAHWCGQHWARCALVAAGLVAVAVAVAKTGGIDFGVLAAVGLGMVVAGVRPVAAAGVVLAAVGHRLHRRGRRTPPAASAGDDLGPAAAGARRRRRGQLRPHTDSAA